MIRLVGTRTNACDFATHIRATIDELETRASESRSNVPTRLQDYVINRVRAGKPQGIWLDGFPLQAAAHFTELLGAVIRDGSEPDLENFSSADWIEVADIGFEIAKKVGVAIRTALQVFLAFIPTGRRIRASVFFGRLSAELLERYDQPGYLDLVKFLEDVARARYPNLVSDLPV